MSESLFNSGFLPRLKYTRGKNPESFILHSRSDIPLETAILSNWLKSLECVTVI
jgi:hypothetical protein